MNSAVEPNEPDEMDAYDSAVQPGAGGRWTETRPSEGREAGGGGMFVTCV